MTMIPSCSSSFISSSFLSASKSSGLVSASGIIALLKEPQIEIQLNAIESLNTCVDYFWHEIADVIPKIEILARDYPLASLLLSKVYFHLANYEESVSYALKAGNLFNINESTCYVQTILTKAIDKYIKLRNDKEQAINIDGSLEAIYERMIEQCLQMKEIKQAIGIALDAQRLDVLEICLKSDPNVNGHLKFAKLAAMRLTQLPQFQYQVLKCIMSIAESLPAPDYIFICECLVSTGEADKCAQILTKLLDNHDNIAMVYQIGFNLYEDATQAFLLAVQNNLLPTTKDTQTLPNLKLILSGSTPIRLRLEFLYKNNHADLMILERTKDTLSVHNSMHHSALTFANAFMQAGTTNDEFLRKNLEWLSYASNWAKFNAASALGVIHKGQIPYSRTILEPYLPKDGVSGSEYSEGGAFFALGLIHAKHGDNELDYLLTSLQTFQSEIIQHGCCLGLGAAGFATQSTKVLEAVKGILYGDNAIAGEAAALAIGMVMFGSGDKELVGELLQYGHETQHEKIIRGISIAIALIMYGQQEEANGIIEQLFEEKDAILRYGGAWTVATAFAGTNSNYAIKKLLHAAVSEADDNVRRASVTALGFVLFKNSEELCRLVDLLAESYNPHVRYGAAIALGLVFAGTGCTKVKGLIRPMCQDLTDFVRQGAYISLAMIQMQVKEESHDTNTIATSLTTSTIGSTEASVTKEKAATNGETGIDLTSDLRKTLEKVATTKGEDVVARFGAILGQGIIDAGGRNTVISLGSATGHNDMAAIAGAVLFCQFWYWYPLVHFASFALHPTALIAVNQDLELPKFDIQCNGKPSLFSYPPPLKPAVAVAPKKLVTAILSTTAKAEKKAKRANTSSMITFTEKEEPESTLMDVDTDDKSTNIVPPVPEPESFKVVNLSRVTKLQSELVSFDRNCRFVPINSKVNYLGGITVVTDTNPKLGLVELISQSNLCPTKPVISESSKSLAQDKTEGVSDGGKEDKVKPPEPFDAAEI